MNVYYSNDYRDFLKRAIEETRVSQGELTLNQVAEVMRINRSYLSRVLSGNANLSSDQMFLTCKFFNLNERETAFVQLLLELARTGLASRKKEIVKTINRMRSEASETEFFLNQNTSKKTLEFDNTYYLDPTIQIVHVALSCECYKNIEAQELAPILAKEIGFDPSHIDRAIELLQKQRLIVWENGAWRTEHDTLHLSPDSPLYDAWKIAIGALSQGRLHSIDKSQKHGFSVTFSADEEAALKVKILFLEFIKKSQKIVEEAPPKSLYQLNFDLFSWNGAKL